MSEYRAPVTNERVAQDLGVTHSAVSRIRSGQRHPSVALMRKITDVYRWKGDRQMRLFATHAYSQEFEKVLGSHYGDEAASA